MVNFQEICKNKFKKWGKTLNNLVNEYINSFIKGFIVKLQTEEDGKCNSVTLFENGNFYENYEVIITNSFSFTISFILDCHSNG